MEQSVLQNYAVKVLIAVTEAITEASADPATQTVTYRANEAAQACIVAAAILLSSRSEGAAPISLHEAEMRVVAGFRFHFDGLRTDLPDHVLDAGKPGFRTHTLA